MIQVSDSLQLGTVDTPLDARTRISTLGDVSNIALPFIGMMFFCASTGKYYRVVSLKAKQIGAAQQANAQIDQYEVLPDKTDLDGKAPADHQHTLSDLSDLSELENQFAAADHQHKLSDLTDLSELGNQFAAADHQHKLSDLSDLSELENQFAAADHQHKLSDLTDLSELENQFAAKEHDHAGSYAPLQEGKVPADYLPENSGAKPATITLPVPFDEDGDNVSLYVDIGTDPQFAEETYTRIRMTDHFAKMRVFYNETFHPLTEGYLGLPEYGATVSFTLDTEMFPGYIPGTTYYARYTWMDSKGAFDGWKGFMFSGDVADMAPIRMEYESPPSVKAETAASGTLSLDYIDGEIQNYRMSSDLSIDLDDVSNVPFGEALICNIRLTGGTLTVSNGTSNQTYMENKTYMVVITNFGTPQIAVTETI